MNAFGIVFPRMISVADQSSHALQFPPDQSPSESFSLPAHYLPHRQFNIVSGGRRLSILSCTVDIFQNFLNSLFLSEIRPNRPQQ